MGSKMGTQLGPVKPASHTQASLVQDALAGQSESLQQALFGMQRLPHFLKLELQVKPQSPPEHVALPLLGAGQAL